MLDVEFVDDDRSTLSNEPERGIDNAEVDKELLTTVCALLFPLLLVSGAQFGPPSKVGVPRGASGVRELLPRLGIARNTFSSVRHAVFRPVRGNRLGGASAFFVGLLPTAKLLPGVAKLTALVVSGLGPGLRNHSERVRIRSVWRSWT